MFGKEGKLGQLRRGETPLTKSSSAAKDHNLIEVGWALTMEGSWGKAKEGDRCFISDF